MLFLLFSAVALVRNDIEKRFYIQQFDRHKCYETDLTSATRSKSDPV
jgi:hypothetical protein